MPGLYGGVFGSFMIIASAVKFANGLYFEAHPDEMEYRGYDGDELFSEDLW